MAKPERILLVMHDQPLGICKACGHKFTGTETEIRQQFSRHDCNEDASQAAARIVREATEG